MRRLPLLFALFSACRGPVAESPASEPLPPSRALSRALSQHTRLAGTPGSQHGADLVAEVLAAAGFRVERDRRRVLLSYPRRTEIALKVHGVERFRRTATFDPDALPAQDVPKFNAWSASGRVEASVVWVGRGLRGDYEALVEAGEPLLGRIAIATYGGAYRGVKAELAEEYGCIGLLLFSDPAEDGEARGPVWPEGPWKPGHEAQRGSISRLAHAPGDPTTPGWPSRAPGQETRRVEPDELAASLPGILCLPIGATDALEILAAGDGARVMLDLDVSRELRPIENVIGRVLGTGEGFVVAGNHRDAWVRGAHDAGSGTVALLRAAQELGARHAAGWRPRCGIVLGFWDAEESGLIGSTEWAEAHPDLAQGCVAYVNADAVVSGTRFRAGGTPGLLGMLQRALERVPAPGGDDEGDTAPANLWEQWNAHSEEPPSLGFPGSGSDYTVFLHHYGLPILDVGFGGNAGGHYHTAFDDFEMIDRYLDPTWEGHETAGLALAEILVVLAEEGRAAFDAAEAASALARMTEERLAELLPDPESGTELVLALEELAEAARHGASDAVFYRALATEDGLEGRPWFKNRFWAPGLETGYASERLPSVRAAVARGPEAVAAELADLVAAVRALTATFEGSAE